MPVRASISSSSPLKSAPPPVSTIPRSTTSAASSGGVRSSTLCTASTICPVTSFKASRVSSEVTRIVFGSPVTRSRPFTSIAFGSGFSNAVPIVILISSAVCSPIIRPYFFRTYFTIASSKSSPATLIEVLTTIPSKEITATSQVPPPMSTIILPHGRDISIPAPMAAAIGSSMMCTSLAPA